MEWQLLSSDEKNAAIAKLAFPERASQAHEGTHCRCNGDERLDFLTCAGACVRLQQQLASLGYVVQTWMFSDPSGEITATCLLSGSGKSHVTTEEKSLQEAVAHATYLFLGGQ